MPCQDVAATEDMQPAQAKPAECSIGGGTCESCKLLKLKASIVRPDSIANIRGPTVWLTSRPASCVADVRPVQAEAEHKHDIEDSEARQHG